MRSCMSKVFGVCLVFFGFLLMILATDHLLDGEYIAKGLLMIIIGAALVKMSGGAK